MPAANGQARDVALHELSHAFSQHADEYACTQTGTFPIPSRCGVNVTKDPTGSKWSQWLGFDDPRGDDLDVGVFEGAAYYSDWRLSPDARQQNADAWPAVQCGRSREVDPRYLQSTFDPLDDWLSNQSPIDDGGALWVEVVDPDVIRVDWYVNDELVAANDGERHSTCRTSTFHPVPTPCGRMPTTKSSNHVGDGSLLDLVRMDFDVLQQEIEWTVNYVVDQRSPGDYNLNGMVDAMTTSVWKASFGSTSNLSADGNGNGRVDSADYTVWRTTVQTLRLQERRQPIDAGAGRIAVSCVAAISVLAGSSGCLAIAAAVQSRRLFRRH